MGRVSGIAVNFDRWMRGVLAPLLLIIAALIVRSSFALFGLLAIQSGAVAQSSQPIEVDEATDIFARELLSGLGSSGRKIAVAEIRPTGTGLSRDQTRRIVDGLERALIRLNGSNSHQFFVRQDFEAVVAELWRSGFYDNPAILLTAAAEKARVEVVIDGSPFVVGPEIKVAFKALDITQGGRILVATREISLALGPIVSESAGIDWQRKAILAKGFGAANREMPRHVWSRAAEEAAKVDAQAKLLELINGSLVTSETFVQNYQISRDEKVKQIRGRVINARQVGTTQYPSDDTAEVILEVRID